MQSPPPTFSPPFPGNTLLNGILETKYTVLKEKLILLFMLGMLVSVAISSFLSLKMVKKELLGNRKSGQKQ
jgi:phosphomevalonate kinase